MNARRRSGFSLMEVLLASGILLACLVVLGQMATVGRQHAEDAESLTTAQLACQARLNEILVGAAPLASQTAEPIADMPEWFCEVEVVPLDQFDLVSIRVTVSPDQADAEKPRRGKSFSLIRWMHAPSVAGQLEGSFRLSSPADAETLSPFGQEPFPGSFLDQ